MRGCAVRKNKWARTCPGSTALSRGTCRWRGPFWSTSRGPCVWPLSMLISRAALTRQSSSRGSTNSRAKGKGPPHDPLPPRERLSVCSEEQLLKQGLLKIVSRSRGRGLVAQVGLLHNILSIHRTAEHAVGDGKEVGPIAFK